MRLIFGLMVALLLISTGYMVLEYDLKGYMLGAFGMIFGAFIYFTGAASTSSDAIEYTDPHDGSDDIIFDVVRTFLLVFISGFLASKIVDISLAGIVNVYMIEMFLTFLLFSYVSFWELKHTVHHVLKAMFMLDSPKKFL